MPNVRMASLLIDSIQYHRNGSGRFGGFFCVRFRQRSGRGFETLIATVEQCVKGEDVEHCTVINVAEPFQRYDASDYSDALVMAIKASGDEPFAHTAEAVIEARAAAKAARRAQAAAP